MKATPSDQLLVLDLVALDRALERAEAARSHPPQAARVKELVALRNEQGRALIEKTNLRDDVRVEMKRVESDIEVAKARQQRDRDRLGTTAIARDARALEAEIASLAERIDKLETRELELMEDLQAAEADLAKQQRLLEETTEEGRRLSAEGKTAVETATAEVASLSSDRAEITAKIPETLLTDYERIAKRTAGAGLLHRGTCGGCTMTLSPNDLAQIARTADDEVVHCPECSCILVRTAESGL